MPPGLPPLFYLDTPIAPRATSEPDLTRAAQRLEEGLRSFSVIGRVARINPGPVVTTYEFEADAGVKSRLVLGLADDVCLAMGVESVRIARTPGRPTFSIEIRNAHRDAIFLRDVLESNEAHAERSPLTIALGKTATGDSLVTPLTQLPHLVIGGETIDRTSPVVTAMLASLLCRAAPKGARVILIDPQQQALSVFDGIPHLLTPVITDPAMAVRAFHWAAREMETRFIPASAEPDARNTLLPDPAIVIVLHDLAALPTLAHRQIEDAICRLGLVSRHVGIHLILTTSRVSKDVLTWLIKAHCPARLSLRRVSKTDSNAILDGTGAEQLLDDGDMLYLAPASARLVRVHGPRVSEAEVQRLTHFWRRTSAPAYNSAVVAAPGR